MDGALKMNGIPGKKKRGISKGRSEKKEKKEHTEKGPKNFSETTFCFSTDVMPLLSVSFMSLFPVVVWVSSLLPATVLLIVDLARIPESPAILHVLQ